MQRDLVIQQLKEEAKKVEQHLLQLQQDEQHTRTEVEQFLSDVEKLYRNLAVYAHVLKNHGDLQMHLKIMQSVPPIEIPPVIEKKEEPVQLTIEEPVQLTIEEPVHLTIEERVEEIIFTTTKENPALKRIEFSINDRFRIINELFFQSQQEFQAALQQLNAISTLEESIFYLDSLKEIYNWKSNNDLVKTMYSLVGKRFM
jgi:hypothetical protein